MVSRHECCPQCGSEKIFNKELWKQTVWACSFCGFGFLEPETVLCIDEEGINCLRSRPPLPLVAPASAPDPDYRRERTP